MSAYVKGAVVSILIIIGCLIWYQMNRQSLPVNQSPPAYGLLRQMEKTGVPGFTATRIDGSKLELSSLKGKLVIVNFWASWCNPCVEEFPSMVKLIDEFKGDVVVIAVSTDEVRDDMTAFLKAFSLPKPNFEVVWDQDRSLMQKYGVEKIPESFIVGRDGKLLRKVSGTENWATPEAISFFKELLGRSDG